MSILQLSPTDVDVLRSMGRNTKHDIRYVLVADWRTNGHGYALTVIRTEKMPEGTEPAEVERRVRIPVNGKIERYIPDAESPRLVASYDAFAASVPRALGNLVKAGDIIYVKFQIGNNTESMKAAGFNHDQCLIEVWRGPANKERLISLMTLDDRVYHDRSAQGGSMRDWHYRPARDGDAA